MSGLFFHCVRFFSYDIRVSQATLLPPSILPPSSEVSRQAGNRIAPVKCLHTQSNRLPAPPEGFAHILDAVL